MFEKSFYTNKKILITGHTGFKGTWLCALLLQAGAQVTGYALEPPTDPSVFNLTNMGKRIQSIIGDIRDLPHLKKVFEEVQPEIVIHMAAQPIVRESYRREKNPMFTDAACLFQEVPSSTPHSSARRSRNGTVYSRVTAPR